MQAQQTTMPEKLTICQFRKQRKVMRVWLYNGTNNIVGTVRHDGDRQWSWAYSYHEDYQGCFSSKEKAAEALHEYYRTQKAGK